MSELIWGYVLNSLPGFENFNLISIYIGTIFPHTDVLQRLMHNHITDNGICCLVQINAINMDNYILVLLTYFITVFAQQGPFEVNGM